MNRDKRLMKFVFISLVISSFSLVLSIFADFNGNFFQIFIAYFSGVLFWLFLIVGYVLLFIISRDRKNTSEINYVNKKDKKWKTVGIINFFSNTKAKEADIFMIIFLICLILCLVIPIFDNNIAMIILSLFLFCFHLHCILNGINYKYVCSLNKKRRY